MTAIRPKRPQHRCVKELRAGRGLPSGGALVASNARVHRFRVLVLLLAIAGAAVAHGDEANAFLIERIEIRNARRVSPEIVIAEARLREGGRYGEGALRDANDRLRRLPFFVDVQFALEKGTERGSYVLVITVNETKPFFYLTDVTVYTSERNAFVVDEDNEGLVGFRAFVGRRGMIHAGIFSHNDDRPYTSDYSALEAGYTQYDLFGTRAFATVSLRSFFTVADGAHILPVIVAGIPLSGSQTLTVEYEHFHIGGDRARRTERTFLARWSYDTTNHPFFPTRGTIVSFTPIVTWSDYSEAAAGAEPARAAHRRTYGIETAVAGFRELSELWSVSLRADGGYAAVDEAGDLLFQTASLTYGSGSLRLTRILSRDTEVEKRLELSLSASSQEKRALRDGFFAVGPDPASMSLSMNWVRRDTWGTLRLGAGYAW